MRELTNYEKDINSRGLSPAGVPYALRDVQLVYPIKIEGWIDVFKLGTVPINTNAFISFTKFLVKDKFQVGVIREYGFIFEGGDIDAISFQFRLDGMLFPQLINQEYPGNVVVQPNDLDRMHYQLNANSKIEFFVKNTSGSQPAEVAVRARGWYY